MCTTCVDCGERFLRQGTRGPKPLRCDGCKKSKHQAACRRRNRQTYVPRRNGFSVSAVCVCRQCKASFKAKTKRSAYCSSECRKAANRSRTGLHQRQCKKCNKQFFANRKRQQYCSPACGHTGSRTRFMLACANAGCGKMFETTPSQYAKGTRCCSRKCRAQHMRLPVRLCQNPLCLKPIQRASSGPSAARFGRDSGKYCSSQCFHDHHWGNCRPRSYASGKSGSALNTCLRRKCKILSVPYDPECTRREVCSRDDWVCQICGVECLKEWTVDKHTRRIDPRSAEHDHIIPLTANGSPGNVFPNSQCLCHACNHKKSDTAFGQLRLDLEGSEKRWEEGGLARSLRRSKSCEAIQAADLSTSPSLSRKAMAL
jgi:hypothetical protein